MQDDDIVKNDHDDNKNDNNNHVHRSDFGIVQDHDLVENDSHIQQNEGNNNDNNIHVHRDPVHYGVVHEYVYANDVLFYNIQGFNNKCNNIN